MAGTIRPGLGDAYNRIAPGGIRTIQEQVAAFNAYLNAIPYCRFGTIPLGAMQSINELDAVANPEYGFFKDGIRDRDLLQIFNGYFSANVVTQGVIGPLFTRAFGRPITDVCRFDPFAADLYVTANPVDTARQILEYKKKILSDGKSNPVPLPEVDPNNLYLPDSFLLDRRKEKNTGGIIRDFIEADQAEVALSNALGHIVNNIHNAGALADADEFRQIVSILEQSKDIHKLIVSLDLGVISDQQHQFLVRKGLMSNNPNQHENKERQTVIRVYDQINDLIGNNNLTMVEKEEIVEGLQFEISREGFFPHKYIENVVDVLSEFNKTQDAPSNLPSLLEYLESFQDPAFDKPENYVSGETKLILNTLNTVFNRRALLIAGVPVYAARLNAIRALMVQINNAAQDGSAGDDTIPVYMKAKFEQNGKLGLTVTRQLNFFDNPGGAGIIDNFSAYHTNIAGNVRSFGSVLAIQILEANGFLNDVSFFRDLSGIRINYAGININNLRLVRFKSLFSTIQTFRALVLFANFYRLNVDVADFLQAVQTKLNGYIAITNETLTLIHGFANKTLDAATLQNLMVICALEYGSSDTGFYFTEDLDAVNYINSLLKQAWKLSTITDENGYREAIQTLTENVYWENFVDELYAGKIIGTCFVYDMMRVGIMGPSSYRGGTSNVEFERSTKEHSAALSCANVAYFVYINTHRFGFPGLGMRKILRIPDIANWHICHKLDLSDSNADGVFMHQFGLNVRSKKQKEETKKKAKKIAAKGKKKKKAEEVKVPDVAAHATVAQLVAHSILYYKKSFLSFKRLTDTFLAICREGGEPRKFERESKPNHILTESKDMKGLDGTWSVHALKRTLLRYNIHVFSSSLHFDSTVHQQRKYGIKCNIGMIFDCGIEYLYSFGTLPPLHIDLNPIEYKTKWTDVKTRMDNIRMAKDTVRVSVKSTPLYKTSPTGIFSIQGKKDGLSTGDVIEIKIKPLKTVQAIFSKLPGIKNLMTQHFDDMEALYLLTGHEAYLLVRSEEEAEFLTFLWLDPSCSMYRETAKALHQNSMIERISTKAGLRAFKDMQYLMGGLDNMTFSNGTFKVEVDEGNDLVHALASKEFGDTLKMERFQTERARELRYLKNESIVDGMLDDIINPGFDLILNNKTAFKRQLINDCVYPQIELRAQEVNDGTIKRISEERAIIKDAEGSLISVNATKAMLSIIRKVFNLNDLETKSVGEIRVDLNVARNNILGGGTVHEKKKQLIRSALEKLEGFEDADYIYDYSSYKRPDIYKPMYTINPKKK